jgi:hypothetical protein
MSTYISVVNFIDRKQSPFRNSIPSFIIWCCIEYTSSQYEWSFMLWLYHGNSLCKQRLVNKDHELLFIHEYDD